MKKIKTFLLAILCAAVLCGTAMAGEREEEDILHEPQGGGYIGDNDLGTWGGGWMKYKLSKRTCDSAKEKCFANVGAVYPGVGFLGNVTTGRTKGTTYKYNEWALGPLGGMKFFGEDSSGRPWMIEIDVAPQYYGVGGHNKEVYKNDQEGIKANVRIEANKITGESSVIGAYVEANIPIKVTRYKSSWKGDKPSNRGSIEIGGYKIIPINDDWDYEFSLAFSKGFWDQQMFIKAVPIEFIYKNRLRIGAGVSIPIGISKIYKGASFKNLLTPWGFIQYDTGPDIRRLNAKANSGRVIPMEKPTGKKTNNESAEDQQ